MLSSMMGRLVTLLYSGELYSLLNHTNITLQDVSSVVYLRLSYYRCPERRRPQGQGMEERRREVTERS